MSKQKFLAGAFVASLALGVIGCGGEEAPKPHEEPAGPKVAQPGPGVEPGPVQPSPVPSLPATTSPMPDEKKEEAKPDDKKVEPKLETPK